MLMQVLKKIKKCKFIGKKIIYYDHHDRRMQLLAYDTMIPTQHQLITKKITTKPKNHELNNAMSILKKIVI